MLAELIATAAIAFAATNVDDLVVLAVLFSRRDKRFHARHIVLGQYLGFAMIVGGCLAAGAWLGNLSDPAVAALGLIPLALGVRGLLIGDDDDDAPRRPVTGTLGWSPVIRRGPPVAGVSRP